MIALKAALEDLPKVIMVKGNLDPVVSSHGNFYGTWVKVITKALTADEMNASLKTSNIDAFVGTPFDFTTNFVTVMSAESPLDRPSRIPAPKAGIKAGVLANKTKNHKNNAATINKKQQSATATPSKKRCASPIVPEDDAQPSAAKKAKLESL